MNIAQISIVNSTKLLYDGEILPILLIDRTTRNNIVWATDEYKLDNNRLGADKSIEIIDITGEFSNRIRPRYSKTLESQIDRTKRKAEVFTPAWICNRMNNDIDENYLKYKDAFNTSSERNWEPTSTPIFFDGCQDWREYVDLTRLEITCGEAPFVTSRYYPSTGEMIALSKRIGFLDRKLRVVAENTKGNDYTKWSLRALQSSYGYEYQGDNLLIARINVFMTWYENYVEKMGNIPSTKEAKEAAKIISWNFWQMDGLTGTVPTKPLYESNQISIFELLGDCPIVSAKKIYSKIYDWRANSSLSFISLKGDVKMKKFYAVIGNPPYQETTEGTSDNPMYDAFMDESYKISKKVELITPARFLFNAGKTNKSWNKKMLSDEHLTVLMYEPDGKKIFPTLSTPLKGGVAITYRDEDTDFGAIGVFSPHPEMTTVVSKVKETDFISLNTIMYSAESYRLTQLFHDDHPEIKEKTIVEKGKEKPLLSKGHEYDLTSNIFSKIGEVFLDSDPHDTEYVAIFGRVPSGRVVKWIKRKYICNHPNLDKYKLFYPEANGSGKFGETITLPEIGEPGFGTMQTFISIGAFETREEAENLYKYVKTKFCRALLGTLKVTQHNHMGAWANVPLQDFTNNNPDINWAGTIAQIDDDLFEKYGLEKTDVDFIKSNVKEMT